MLRPYLDFNDTRHLPKACLRMSMWSPSKLGEDRGNDCDLIVPLELYPGLHAQELSMTSVRIIEVSAQQPERKLARTIVHAEDGFPRRKRSPEYRFCSHARQNKETKAARTVLLSSDACRLPACRKLIAYSAHRNSSNYIPHGVK